MLFILIFPIFVVLRRSNWVGSGQIGSSAATSPGWRIVPGHAPGPLDPADGFTARLDLVPQLMETIAGNRVSDAMSENYRIIFTNHLLVVALPIALLGASASANTAVVNTQTDPMRFFEGRTESISTIKLIMRKSFESRSLGRGEIDSGVLNLVQRVQEDGKSPFDRRWRMRQVGPGRFAGTMTEAVGPVAVEEVGERYRFRFKMKGNVSVEQWLTPLPGGKVARSNVTIRKLGMTVGRSDGTIRKL